MRYQHNFVAKLGLLSLIILKILGCGQPDSRYGTENRIVVIADDADWAVVEKAAKEVFEKEYFTPQPEMVFTLHKIKPEELNSFTKWRNICLITTLQTKGKVSEIINANLSEHDRNRVEKDSSFVFQSKDPWAKDQILLIVIAKDQQTLLSRLQEKSEVLFNLFDMHASELAAKTIDADFESKELADKLQQEYGWTLNIQRDFFEAVNSAEDHFVWLRRLGPQRWMFVHWDEIEDPSVLSEEWVTETRNRFAEKYYRGDVIVDSLTKKQEVDFIGKYAIRLDGHWTNDSLHVGGAFRNYSFYDEESSRIYLIDLAVLAPGERKLPYIRQLDAMAHTFKSIKE